MLRVGKNLLLKIVIAAALVCGAMGCDRQEEEQDVLNVVTDGISLIEKGDVGKSMRLTTQDFLAQPGKMNRAASTRRLMMFLRGNKGIQIVHPEPVVEINGNGDTALVSMPFVVAKEGADVEELNAHHNDPDEWAITASAYTTVQNVEISLVRQNDRWMVRTVRF